LVVLAAIATAAPAALGATVRPLARWSFEYDMDEWQSRDSQVSRNAQRVRDGGWSLRVDVDFPQPATVSRRVNLDMDLVGRVVYHVFVPGNAPETIKTLLFLKDKDGLWFQHFRQRSLQRGAWNAVSVDISASSPHLRPSGHYALWNSVNARRMNQIGIKFFCDDRYQGSLHVDQVLAFPAARGRPPLRLISLRENTLKVGRYEKFEVTFDINRPVGNPFDPDHIKIDATFVGPKGKRVKVPAFYYQGFHRELKNDREELTPVGAGVWKVRFAPVSLGPHSYYLAVHYSPDRRRRGQPAQLITTKRRFACVESKSRGFVRVSKKDPNYFEFDNGKWFYPIGHNVHSPFDDTPRAVNIQRSINADILPDHGTFSYDYLLKKMAENGENFAEVWMCAWWLGLEWLQDWKNYNGLTSYNLRSAWRLDYLIELAQRHDLYLHVVIDNHGKCSSWCDPEWEDNPYNELNGGFLSSPEDFFRNPIAREIYKKKLRYIIARWGYSTRVAGLELWSEVDLVGDSYNFHSDAVAAAPKVQWHREIASYLDHLDPWNHPITTHFSTTYSRIRSTLVSIPGIDYITCDAYKFGGGSIIKLMLATARAFNNYGKPGIVTEYGGNPFGSSIPGLRADLHAGLWSTYMTHTSGTPLLWWFQFIESDDLYWNFKALAAFHEGEERLGEGLVNRTVSFPNPHHDLGALCLQNQRKAYVWVYSSSSMERMPRRKLAPVFKGISIQLSGLDPGKYRVEVWDTYKGERITQSTLDTRGSALTIPLPEFRTDCAIKVKPAS